MKTKNIVLRAITILFSVLMFVPMVVNFVTVTMKLKSSSNSSSEGLKLSDLTKDFLSGSKAYVAMTIGKVLFYVAFALAMVLVVLEVVRFVLKKKNNLVETLTKWCSILVLIISILSFALTFIWGIANGGTFLGVQYNYWPWVGGVLTLVFGVVAGICGLKEAKADK